MKFFDYQRINQNMHKMIKMSKNVIFIRGDFCIIFSGIFWHAHLMFSWLRRFLAQKLYTIYTKYYLLFFEFLTWVFQDTVL